MPLSITRKELDELTMRIRTQLVNNEIRHYRVCGVILKNMEGFKDVVTRAKEIGCSFAELTTALNNVVLADKGKGKSDITAGISVGSFSVLSGRGDVRTSTLWYDGEGPKAIAKTLVKDKAICKFANDNTAGLLVAVLRREKGLFDFEKVQEVADKVGALPVRTSYSLNEFVLVQTPNSSVNDGIRFHAKRDIDWEVLTKILHDHAMESSRIVGGASQ
jgi:hypothetical protein